MGREQDNVNDVPADVSLEDPEQTSVWLQSVLGGSGRLSDDRVQAIAESLTSCVAPPKSPIPSKLGPFTLKERIGAGGMGVVYVGVHGNTGVRGAVKFVSTSFKIKADALRAEAQALATATGPNIVRILDTGEQDGVVWLATELVVGSTLREQMEAASGDAGGKPLDPRRTMKWCRDLARALQTLHDLGHVHRDIKPENIVIAKGGAPYLIDFGLSASHEDPKALRGAIAGTWRYMSPEQVTSGYIDIGPASDLYSLAVTFYEALTQRRLREGNHAEIVEQILFDGSPTPPSQLAPDVDRSIDPLFRRALNLRPKERYASLGEFADDIDRWLNGEPLVGGERTKADEWREAAKRRPWAVALVGLVLIGGVLGITLATRAHFERSATLDTLRELVVSDTDTNVVFAELCRLTADFENNDRFIDLVRLATKEARARTLELINSQRFTTTISQGTAKSPREESMHARYGREAAALLSVVDDPDLVFHVAFSQLMLRRKAPTDALATVERYKHLLDRSPFLIQLYSLLLYANQRFPEAKQALTRLDSSRFQQDQDIYRCFDAYRLLWGLRIESVLRLEPELQGQLPTLESDLTEILDRRPDLSLARVLRCRGRMSAGKYALALEDAEKLKAAATSDVEKAGTLNMCSFAAAWAGATTEERRHEYFTRSAADAVQGLQYQPATVANLLGTFAFKPVLDRFEWLEHVLDAVRSAGAKVDVPHLLAAVAEAAYLHEETGTLARIHEYEAKWYPAPDHDNSEVARYRAMLSLGFLREVQDQLEAGETAGSRSDLVALCDRAISLAQGEIQRLGDNVPDQIATLGLAYAARSQLTENFAETEACRQNALKTLRHFMNLVGGLGPRFQSWLPEVPNMIETLTKEKS